MKRYKPFFKFIESSFFETITIVDKNELRNFYKKLPKKGVKKFNGKFSNIEFIGLHKIIILPPNDYIKNAPKDTPAYYRSGDFTIYINAKMMQDIDFTWIMLHELAHTRNYGMKNEVIINEINRMREFLINDNYDGGWSYSINDPKYELQEIHSRVYERFKVMGHVLDEIKGKL